MTFQLDRSNKYQYTWNDLWVHPYESTWGLWEKFKAANVMPVESLNKVIRINYNEYARPVYDEKIFSYRRGAISFSQMLPERLRYGCFEVFQDVSKVINPRLTYCPQCIQNGYNQL